MSSQNFSQTRKRLCELDAVIGGQISIDIYPIGNDKSQILENIEIYNNAIIGGLSAVHQFVSIGKYAMIGGMSGVGKNIIPFDLASFLRSSLWPRFHTNS